MTPPFLVTLVLIIWGNVLLATVPHALYGPLRPVPLGHLTWLLSALVLLWSVGPFRRMEMGRSPGSAVTVGLLTGLLVGILGGTQNPVTILVGIAIIAVVAIGHQSGVALVAITAVALAFHGRIIGDGTPAPDTPPWRTWGAVADRFNPNAILDPTDPGQLDLAIAYGRSLFAGEPLPPTDEAPLASPTGPGPLARLWPESRAYLISPVVLKPAELGRGRTGRIVARLWVDPASGGYDPLGLWAGTTYLWVDNLDLDAMTARGVLIADDGSGVRTRSLSVVENDIWGTSRPEWANYSRGHWEYAPEGDGLLVSCFMNARCRLAAGTGAP